MTEKRKGRPPEPVPTEAAEHVLNRLVDGTGLTVICADMDCAPSTVYRWAYKDEAFAQQFARAREYSADALVDQAQEIADTATPENVQVAKLRCEMLWKRAACFRPSKYGQKSQVAHEGGLSIQVVTGVPRET